MDFTADGRYALASCEFSSSMIKIDVRRERVTRTIGHDMLVTQATLALLDSDHGGFEECERVELKGKTEEVRLYAPVALGAVDYSTTPAATTPAATSE